MHYIPMLVLSDKLKFLDFFLLAWFHYYKYFIILILHKVLSFWNVI